LGGGSLKSLIQTILTTFPTSEITEDEINDMYYPATVYGFSIDQTESDPNSIISYISGTTNENYTPAHMDYDNDVFDYGDWGNAFFIKNLRPCMLNYDGTEACLLDPNDYTKTISGEDSYNSDTTVAVMVGIPKVYFKIVPIDDDHCNFYFSDKKVDNNYHCWAHINNYGDEVPYCYLSPSTIYTGSLNVLSPEVFANYANNINQNGDNIWSIWCYSDWLLIALLSLLISKTTDSRTAFGQGSYASGGYTRLDQKGLFWGSADRDSDVKIFGIENLWGSNMYRFIYGLIDADGILKAKLTYGTQDGSTTEGYNFTGDGYIEVGEGVINSGYFKSLLFTKNGIFIKDFGSYNYTKSVYCAWTNNSKRIDADGMHYSHPLIACIGGETEYTGESNMLSITIETDAVSGGWWSYNSAIKCLPKLAS
jgi:hypothetical protein